MRPSPFFKREMTMKRSPEETRFLCESLIRTWIDNHKRKTNHITESLNLVCYGDNGSVIDKISLDKTDRMSWSDKMTGLLYNAPYSGISRISATDEDNREIGEIEVS